MRNNFPLESVDGKIRMQLCVSRISSMLARDRPRCHFLPPDTIRILFIYFFLRNPTGSKKGWESGWRQQRLSVSTKYGHILIPTTLSVTGTATGFPILLRRKWVGLEGDPSATFDTIAQSVEFSPFEKGTQFRHEFSSFLLYSTNSMKNKKSRDSRRALDFHFKFLFLLCVLVVVVVLHHPHAAHLHTRSSSIVHIRRYHISRIPRTEEEGNTSK